MSETKASKTEKLLHEGKILASWPFKDGAWALSIAPIVNIDKVKFSFFKKGEKGKGFDVFVNGIDFLILADTLRRVNHNLATKWEYKTGEKGSKQVTVEKGQSCLLAIHGFAGSKENSATVGINMQEASQMLVLWQTFFKPEFEKKWTLAFLQGQKDTKSWRENVDITEEDTDFHEPAPESNKADTKTTENETPAITTTSEGTVLSGKVTGDIEEKGDFYKANITPIDSESPIGTIWVKKDADLKLEAGATIKALVEVNGSNYKYLKTV